MFCTLQTDLEKQLERLRKECEERHYRLEEAKNLYEYLREAEDLEHFISDQMQLATSEDYGQDFEHLQVLCGYVIKMAQNNDCICQWPSIICHCRINLE